MLSLVEGASYLENSHPTATSRSFPDASDAFRQRDLFVEVDHPLDHDPLCLWRAGAVDAFGQVRGGAATYCHVLNELEYLYAVDGGDAIPTLSLIHISEPTRRTPI